MYSYILKIYSIKTYFNNILPFIDISSKCYFSSDSSTNTACKLGLSAKGSGFEFHKVSTAREMRARF